MKLRLIAACAAAALGLTAIAYAQETPTEPTAPATEQTAPAEATPAPEAAPPEAATPPVAATPPAPPVDLPSQLTAPPAGKGQIVFFRPNRFVGMALSFTVRENEVALGRLPNARYFVHVAEPGIHEYEIGRNDTMRIEIEDGETYYAMQNTTMGVVAGRAVLTPSDRAAFEAAVGRMRVSEPVAAE